MTDANSGRRDQPPQPANDSDAAHSTSTVGSVDRRYNAAQKAPRTHVTPAGTRPPVLQMPTESRVAALRAMADDESRPEKERAALTRMADRLDKQSKQPSDD